MSLPTCMELSSYFRMLPCSALSRALTTALMHPPDGRVHVLLEMA